MVVAAAAIGAAGTLASTALKSGSGSSNSTSQTTNQESSHLPMPGQDAAIGNALAAANNAFDARSQAGPYTGNLYTGLNADQRGASAQGVAFGSGAGINAANSTLGTAAQGAGALGASVGTANGVAANGIGPQNSALAGALANYGTGATPVVNSGLSGALNASATAGAQQIGNYNNGLQSVINSATSDPTHQLAGDAQTYMNSGATQAMLNNVNGQIDNTLNETTVPGLNRQAAMGGNINSSRAGMAEAMANRDAALAKGNADSQIMNNAYNTGLGVASSQHTAGLNTAAAAASAGLTGNSNLAIGAGNQDIGAANTAISAANSGLSQDTNYGAANASAKLNAASELNANANTSINGNTAGINQGAAATNLYGAAGGLIQQDANAQNAANYQSWNNTNQYQQNVAKDYMGLATAPQGFYTASGASQSVSTPPSALPSLLAGGATAFGSQFAKGGAFAPGGALYNWFNGNGGNGTAAGYTADPNGVQDNNLSHFGGDQ